MKALAIPLLVARLLGHAPSLSRTDALPLVSASDTLATLTTITADTGAFAPGDRDYSRYSNVTLCLMAAQRRQHLLRSSAAAEAFLDTLHDLRADTVGTASVAVVARACGARFTLPGTTPRELPALAWLALAQGNDTLAQRIVQRRIAATADTAQMVAWSEQLFLTAAPARIALADILVAWLDTLHRPSLLPVQFEAHARLLDFWLTARNYAAARQEAERMIVLGHSLTGAELTPRGDGSYLLRAYRALMAAAFWSDYPDSLTVIARRAQQDFRRFMIDSKRDRLYAQVSHAPIDSVVPLLAPELYNMFRSGPVLPPLHADYWFPAVGGDTLQPAPGKVTLEVGADPHCTITYDVGNDWHCFAPIALALRRWVAQYNTVGLAIVVVISTDSYTLMDGAVRPADYAARARWYFHDYWKLPVTVAVQAVSYIYLPLPDGRRERTGRTQFQRYLNRQGGRNTNGFVQLFGRDRRLLYTTDTWQIEWAQEGKSVDQCLAALLGAHPLAKIMADLSSMSVSHTAPSATQEVR